MIVYRLISPSGKSYIGLTSKKLSFRLRDHIYKCNLNRGCPKLRSAFAKYPPNMWYNEVLYETNNTELAKQEEKEFIKIFDSIENGYNILPGGDVNTLGRKLTNEHKLKISQGLKGRIVTKTTKDKISQQNKGKIRTEETKEKLRFAKIGITPSIETRKKMSLSQIQRNLLNDYNKTYKNLANAGVKTRFQSGHKLTKEHRDKLSALRKGKKGYSHTPETKLKMSLARRNKPRPEGLCKYWENRRKLSNAS